ncbi:unnamed protein product, partial [Discosporangium mesarthrocarpum]
MTAVGEGLSNPLSTASSGRAPKTYLQAVENYGGGHETDQINSCPTPPRVSLAPPPLRPQDILGSEGTISNVCADDTVPCRDPSALSRAARMERVPVRPFGSGDRAGGAADGNISFAEAMSDARGGGDTAAERFAEWKVQVLGPSPKPCASETERKVHSGKEGSGFTPQVIAPAARVPRPSRTASSPSILTPLAPPTRTASSPAAFSTPAASNAPPVENDTVGASEKMSPWLKALLSTSAPPRSQTSKFEEQNHASGNGVLAPGGNLCMRDKDAGIRGHRLECDAGTVSEAPAAAVAGQRKDELFPNETSGTEAGAPGNGPGQETGSTPGPWLKALLSAPRKKPEVPGVPLLAASGGSKSGAGPNRQVQQVREGLGRGSEMTAEVWKRGVG